MVKTLYGKYIDDVVNIGVYIPIFVAHEVWVYISYPFQAIPFSTFHLYMKVKWTTIKKYS